MKNFLFNKFFINCKLFYFPILRGPAKGKRWIILRGKVFRFLFYTYENKVLNIFCREIKDKVVYDIGAHFGYFTLLSSIFAKKVYSFEPCNENFNILKKHVEINKCNNTILINKAVSDTSRTIYFKKGNGSGSGRVSSKFGDYTVSAVSLDDFVFFLKNQPPEVMKIDVEGEEFNVLVGSKNVLNFYHPIIFLSIHSADIYNLCWEFLKSLGYRIKFQIGKDLIVG